MKLPSLLFLVCLLIITLPVYADHEFNESLYNSQDKHFSYIWLANSGEGTISKIDIDTGQELAKYYTGKEVNTKPCYIAVDIEGNCWVVNYNSGTVLKILVSDYIDKNNNGIKDTSFDFNEDGQITDDEVLPWGEDEVVIEITDFIENKPVTIAVDKENRIWIGLANPAKYIILRSDGTYISEVDIIGIPFITTASSKGFIWSYNRELNLMEVIDLKNMTYIGNYTFEDRIKDFILDGNGQVWGITDGNKLFRFNIEEEKTVYFSVPDRDFRGIANDMGNNIWLLSADKKLLCFNTKGKPVYYKNLKIDEIEPDGIIIDYKNIWTINSKSDSISKFDMKGNYISTYSCGSFPINRGDITGYKLWYTAIETAEIDLQQALDKEEFYSGDIEVTALIDLKGLGTSFSRKNPIDLIMIIDVSGSMSGTPINNVKKASREIINLLQGEDRGAIVTFTSTAYLRQEFTQDNNALVETINRLSVGGGTDIARGIQSAISHFNSNGRKEAQKVAILLSDGGSSAAEAIRQAEIAAENNIIIFTLGIGNGVIQDLLRQIADITKGTYYFSPTPEQIGQMMEEIGGQIFNISGRDVLLQINIPVLPQGLSLANMEPEPDKMTIHENGTRTLEYNYIGIQMKQGEIIKINYSGKDIYSDKYYLTESIVLTYTGLDGEKVKKELDGLYINVKERPGFLPLGNKATYEGIEIEFELGVRNFPGNSLIFSVNNLPKGAIFNPETGIFSWVPDYEQAGEYEIQFEVTDNTYTDKMDVKITVFNMNRPPVIDEIGDKEVIEGETLEFKIVARDPDGDELEFSVGNLPEGAAFDTMTQTFSWTPEIKQVGFYPDITFYVIDRKPGDDRLMAFEKMNITVLPADKIPPVTTVSLKGDKWSDGWFKSDVEVTLTAIDNLGGTGIEAIYYRIGETGTFKQYNGPFMIREDGSHQLYVYAMDKQGNQEIPHLTEVKISKPWVIAPYTILVQELKSYGEIRVDSAFSNGNVTLYGNCAFNYLGTHLDTITEDGEIKISNLELSAPYRSLPVPDWEKLKNITVLRQERQLVNNYELSNIRFENDLSIVGNSRLKGLLVVDGNLEIHGETILDDVGIFCTGKVTITGNTKINGFIYSGGDIIIYGQPDFTGAMIVNGQALIAGNFKNSIIDIKEYLQWLKRVDLKY